MNIMKLILVISMMLTSWTLVVMLLFTNPLPNPRVKEWLNSAQVIYKLENNQYTQITSLDQIKDGIYIIIR